MKRHFAYFVWLICSVILLVIYSTENQKAENPTPQLTSSPTNPMATPCLPGKSLCYKCHHTNQISFDENDLSRSCDEVCMECHKLHEAHHPVGMIIEFPLDKHLRLKSGNRLACMTCHDHRIPRYSDTARKAQSLFSRIFQSQKQYKTYYLSMDNRKGQLCKECHD